MIVSLQNVANELDGLPDEAIAYLNKCTGELITLSREELSAAEEDLEIDEFPSWQQDLIEKAKDVIDSEEYLRLPTKYDINEYRIMEDFCYSFDNQRIRTDLLDKIKGRGAFRRFKDAVHFLGIEDEWYRFREEVLRSIARDWLEENGIAFE